MDWISCLFLFSYEFLNNGCFYFFLSLVYLYAVIIYSSCYHNYKIIIILNIIYWFILYIMKYINVYINIVKKKGREEKVKNWLLSLGRCEKVSKTSSSVSFNKWYINCCPLIIVLYFFLFLICLKVLIH